MLHVKNNVQGELSADITDTDTSLTLKSGQGADFPDVPFHITIDDEILEVTAVSTDTFTVTRAVEDTTAAAHSTGAVVSLNDTAGVIQEMQTAITNHTSDTNNPHNVTKAQVGINSADDIPEGSTNKYFNGKTQDDLPDGTTYKQFDPTTVATAAQGDEADTALQNVVEDTTPQLGGELDAQAHSIGFTLQTYTGGGGTTTTIDFTAGNKVQFTFGAGDETLAFTAPSKPCNLVLVVIQDSTGGRTITWPSTCKWAGGTAPTLSTAANAIDIVSFFYDGTNYYGIASYNFS